MDRRHQHGPEREYERRGALTFTWPANGNTSPITPTVLTSTHPGIVVLYFFDGHGDKIRADNPTNVNPDSSAAPGVVVPQ